MNTIKIDKKDDIVLNQAKRLIVELINKAKNEKEVLDLVFSGKKLLNEIIKRLYINSLDKNNLPLSEGLLEELKEKAKTSILEF